MRTRCAPLVEACYPKDGQSYLFGTKRVKNLQVWVPKDPSRFFNPERILRAPESPFQGHPAKHPTFSANLGGLREYAAKASVSGCPRGLVAVSSSLTFPGFSGPANRDPFSGLVTNVKEKIEISKYGHMGNLQNETKLSNVKCS